jgi:NH3-dependent NAD+ synthetase
MPILPNMHEALFRNRVNALREAHRQAGIPRAELDLSGGIDSAVMAVLLVEALGPENVTLVHSRFSTDPDQSTRARDLAEGLGCPLVNLDGGAVWEVLLGKMCDALDHAGYDMTGIAARCAADPTILGSIRSCLRAPIGRGFNRMTGGGLRHGTGNECEDRFLRFYQKGGDGEVDSNPLAMLSKGEVYQLAWHMAQRFPAVREVLLKTIEAVPTPDLWGAGVAQSDESELLSWTGFPFTYSRIDITYGEYTQVGTIERMNRFLDSLFTLPDGSMATGEKMLFGDLEPKWEDLMVLALLALQSPLFSKYVPSDIGTEREDKAWLKSYTGAVIQMFRAARKVEQSTRHKMNPNIPTYGSRQDLTFEGILTNALPDRKARTSGL